jgi:hypothetical protein
MTYATANKQTIFTDADGQRFQALVVTRRRGAMVKIWIGRPLINNTDFHRSVAAVAKFAEVAAAALSLPLQEI